MSEDHVAPVDNRNRDGALLVWPAAKRVRLAYESIFANLITVWTCNLSLTTSPTLGKLSTPSWTYPTTYVSAGHDSLASP